MSPKSSRDRIEQALDALSEHERLAIELLSALYLAVPRSTFINAMRALDIKDETGRRAYTLKSLDAFSQRLANTGLVRIESDGDHGCEPEAVELISRAAVAAGRFERVVEIARRLRPLERGWREEVRYRSFEEGLREARFCLHADDADGLDATLKRCANAFPESFFEVHPLVGICNQPFDIDWLMTKPRSIAMAALAAIVDHSMRRLEPCAAAWDALQTLCRAPSSEPHPEADRVLCDGLILRGDLDAAWSIACREAGPEGLMHQGWIRLLRGETTQAIADYEASLRRFRRGRGRSKSRFAHLAGAFYPVALIEQDEAPDRDPKLGKFLELPQSQTNSLDMVYTILNAFRDAINVSLASGDRQRPVPKKDLGTDGWAVYFTILTRHWAGRATSPADRKWYERFVHKAQSCELHLLAGEVAEIIARGASSKAELVELAEIAKQARQRSGARPLCEIYTAETPWQRALSALLRTVTPGDGGSEALTALNERFVWFIDRKYGGYDLEPRIQKRSASGKWTKGRPVALKRLYEERSSFDCLTDADTRVCMHIDTEQETSYYGRYASTCYVLDNALAFPALVGHPYLFWADDPTTSVELVAGAPELVVKRSAGRIKLSISPAIPATRGYLIEKETPTRLKMVRKTRVQGEIADVLGAKGLEVPREAESRVLDVIRALSPALSVQSDLGAELDDPDIEVVAADPRPCIHLRPHSAGLKADLCIKPMGPAGPAGRPGRGAKNMIALVEGTRRQTTRDLSDERARASQVISACSTLATSEDVNGEWYIEEPEMCLELLDELRALGDAATVVWPEGEKLRVTRTISTDQLRVRVRRNRDWFAISGQLQIDDDTLLEMGELLGLLESSEGRFVPLGEGQFLTLTLEFRRRLDELVTCSERTAQGARFRPIAALSIDDLLAEVGATKSDKAWRDLQTTIQRSLNFTPTVPTTVRAELRDYQRDGFRWLARLAEWGVGACLADDMGLGKTLQALAVMVARAANGPCLVVAPTSVMNTWLREAQRFAPTLRPVVLGSRGREATLEGLGPFDMLVCSYGLLQNEIDGLGQIPFEIVVLDEAQAIKNATTKRALAAFKLQGRFRMATTGTPIENHLGELWSLFRFLNPGLLGTYKAFTERFAVPIERDDDRTARQRLRKLVRPFLLRRTKDRVLEELPPRTNIVVDIELGPAERALYEAQRQRAITRLAQAATESAPGPRHLQILAEITRLRRLCCASALVFKDSPVPSAKLARFGELLDDLLSNQHKALVFSQFVDHLRLIRAHLEERGVPYQYLDGSTPAAARVQRVDAFQAGQGDVFLISLRAGGLGLNLTAADYVIHMDPWWNPAVEDQASDRAHRIGQTRPVTIYRLVAQNTIEEKIVELHHQKRDLADSLLEGADVTGKLSAEALLRLIDG